MRMEAKAPSVLFAAKASVGSGVVFGFVLFFSGPSGPVAATATFGGLATATGTGSVVVLVTVVVVFVTVVEVVVTVVVVSVSVVVVDVTVVVVTVVEGVVAVVVAAAAVVAAAVNGTAEAAAVVAAAVVAAAVVVGAPVVEDVSSRPEAMELLFLLSSFAKRDAGC
mmetsp:Transcript_4462/g.10366  ORF Transcript_4462/g.10366 Transcript_4462/m.10366 type:complete len:166 (+) Transcript_4462:392-889(+)